MLYYFAGNEEYLKKKELEKIKNTVLCPELNVAEFGEPVPELYGFMETGPFVGDKKVCILYFFPEQAELLDVFRNLPGFLDVYIVARTFPDMRKKVSREIAALAEKREFEKIDERLLFRCITATLQRHGHTEEEIVAVGEELKAAFHAYVMYADMDLGIVQKHARMMGFCSRLTPESIRAFAPDGADLRAFRLSAMLLSGNRSCLDFARCLLDQGEQGIGILSLVAYQIRICYKAVLFKKEKYLSLIGISNYQLYKDFSAYEAKTYKEIYHILMEGIRRIKKGEEKLALVEECLLEALVVLERAGNR